MQEWVKEYKKRTDSYIDGDVVNDPNWGPIETVVVNRNGNFRIRAIKGTFLRRLEGHSNTGKNQDAIDLGCWKLMNRPGEGEYPSQAMEDCISRMKEQRKKLAREIESAIAMNELLIQQAAMKG